MSHAKDAPPTTSLHDLIEIVREPQPSPSPDSSFPSHFPGNADESSPLYTLQQLADALETTFDRDTERNAATITPQHEHHPQVSSDSNTLERYLELFQRQSIILRKLMSKLN